MSYHSTVLGPSLLSLISHMDGSKPQLQCKGLQANGGPGHAPSCTVGLCTLHCYLTVRSGTCSNSFAALPPKLSWVDLPQMNNTVMGTGTEMEVSVPFEKLHQ